MSLFWILLMLAAICFGVAALNVSHPRCHFGWLGMLLAAIAELGRSLAR